MKMHGHALPIAILSAILWLVASCGISSGSGDSRGGVPNYTPTLTGIALRDNLLTSVDQKLFEGQFGQ